MKNKEQTTLGEYISGLKPTKRIRIGCKPGGGFIYEGTVADLNLAILYKKCSLDFALKVSERMALFATATDHGKLRKSIQPLMDKFYNMKPFGTREVLMDYPGQFEPDVRVIIIPGEEKLFDYEPDVPPLTPETMDDQAVQRLVEAIYEGAAEDLTCNLASMKRCGTREGRDRARASAQHIKRWIRSDPYGILDQPEGIVTACQIRAEQMIESNEVSMKKRK